MHLESLGSPISFIVAPTLSLGILDLRISDLDDFVVTTTVAAATVTHTVTEVRSAASGAQEATRVKGSIGVSPPDDVRGVWLNEAKASVMHVESIGMHGYVCMSNTRCWHGSHAVISGESSPFVVLRCQTFT